MNDATKAQQTPRLIAFYLTQFHPIPENDEWWGKGFTEWTNVTKAKPLFVGHYQPQLPTDFGFYDLRVRDTRRDQIRVAKEYGIDGFCYHYYWFSGKRLLNAPLDDMLADPESDMPFCLCWANENWTRRWDAAEHEVLIAQRYLPEDDLEFIKSLQPFFADPRYIRVDGKPFLIVYRPQHLPDARLTAQVWRDYCRGSRHRRNPYLRSADPRQPRLRSVRLRQRRRVPAAQPAVQQPGRPPFLPRTLRGYVVEYAEVATAYLDRRYEHPNVFRGVFPAWDNTARTGNRAVVVLGSSPDNYEHWLARVDSPDVEDFPGRRPAGVHQCLERVGGRLSPRARPQVRARIPRGNAHRPQRLLPPTRLRPGRRIARRRGAAAHPVLGSGQGKPLSRRPVRWPTRRRAQEASPPAPSRALGAQPPALISLHAAARAAAQHAQLVGQRIEGSAKVGPRKTAAHHRDPTFRAQLAPP